MKRYIRSASVAELESKLERARTKEKEQALIQPVIDRIRSAYSEITGFKCKLWKYFYRPDLESVLLCFEQYYNYGDSTLCTYSNPGKAKPSNPAMISMYATDDEVDAFVDRLVDGLVRCVQHTFNSKYTIDALHGIDNDISDDHVIYRIIREAAVVDEAKASQFIYDLLSSGEVVNNLAQYLAQYLD